MSNTEMRETEWLVNGDQVLVEPGVWWRVDRSTPQPDGRLSLLLSREHNGRTVEEVTWIGSRDELWRTLDTTPRGGSLRSER